MGITSALLWSQAPASASENAKPNRASALTLRNFEGLVNSSFELRSGTGERSWLVLTKVEELETDLSKESKVTMAVAPPRRRAATHTEAFALHFYAVANKVEQGTYTVEHATLGMFDLFVTPSGPTSYTAVFNRISGR